MLSNWLCPIVILILGAFLMAKSLDLDKRSVGPWAHFEMYLMKPENEHVGWISWINKQMFKLKKNPLADHPMSRYIYVAHEDICNKLPEQGLIRIVDGKEHKEVKHLHGNLGEYAFYYIVEGFEELNQTILPKPYLTKDEFLSRVTQTWRRADDHPLFQKELAYNMLSCQKDFFGTGGVGVETFAPFGGRKTLNYLISSVNSMLPNNFKRKNNNFEFEFIKKNGDVTSFLKRRNNPKTSELSYNNVGSLDKGKIRDIPVQIPLIFPEDAISDKYTSSLKGIDVDILDYQLTALAIKPTILPKDIEKFSDLAMKTSEYIGKNYSEDSLLLDSFSHLRIASTICRLNLKNTLTDSILSSAKNDIYEMFKQYADTYQDSLISGGNRFNIPMDPMASHRRLSTTANKTYKNVLDVYRLNKEMGYDWISTSELNTNYPSLMLMEALQELNNNNLIIQRKNFSEVLIVNYQED